MKTLLAALLAISATLPAQAQYYERGYDRGYRPPPGYYAPRERYGRHCDAVARTPYGPRQVFCRIVEPKPLGMECACPPPPPPPGYAPGPFVPGRTVR